MLQLLFRGLIRLIFLQAQALQQHLLIYTIYLGRVKILIMDAVQALLLHGLCLMDQHKYYAQTADLAILKAVMN